MIGVQYTWRWSLCYSTLHLNLVLVRVVLCAAEGAVHSRTAVSPPSMPLPMHRCRYRLHRLLPLRPPVKLILHAASPFRMSDSAPFMCLRYRAAHALTERIPSSCAGLTRSGGGSGVERWLTQFAVATAILLSLCPLHVPLCSPPPPPSPLYSSRTALCSPCAESTGKQGGDDLR